jgi:hypothetical protein
VTTDTLPYISSNMDNEECFRLHGTLPADRIAALLDAEANTIASAARINEHVQAAHDGLPCEDFAEDIVWRLESLLVDHETTDALRDDIEEALDKLRALQADLYARAEAAVKHLQGIEDELSMWVAS